MLPLIPLVPLLPLLGFLFCGLAGRRASPRVVALVACGAVLGALIISAGAVWELSGGEVALASYETAVGVTVDGETHRFDVSVWKWLPLGSGLSVPPGDVPSFEIPLSFSLDPLSAVMILVVNGVGFLLHVYSVGYMAGDPGFSRYFSYLNLFTAMMLTLVLGGNFLVMFVGWEGVGLCSYLLIGFWYEDRVKAAAGRKAFIVNRIGDLGFLLAILAIAGLFGTLDFAAVMEGVSAGRIGPVGSFAATGVALLLFIGACGKSAQIPLYVWLPDAMAGPTPVSALIHAATMVTAGVYMVARCAPLYLHAPAAMAVVAVVGAGTAVLAATIGLAQNDIKKVLAYSTISQLGLMFLGAGVGAFVASIFHLVTHAFFKALLFLGSGSVIHAMGGEQDMRRMGGLKGKLPVTYWTFLIGAIAISGIPPLAGFFSKDEILAAAWGAGRPAIWAVGSFASLLTAFYMFRLVMLTFHGRFRGTAEQEHHLHESPRSMTVPLVILAVLSVVGGWIGVPAVLGEPVGVSNGFEHWMEPLFPAHHAGEAAHGTEHPPVLMLMFFAVAVGAAGIGAAVFIYRAGSNLAARFARGAGPVYSLIANRYWVDELYEATVLRAYYAGCDLFNGFDRIVVDGAVNASATVAQGTSQIVRLFQNGFVRSYALLFLIGSAALLWYLVS
jgi:NADH-quinone oxidoreductase subunit L